MCRIIFTLHRMEFGVSEYQLLTLIFFFASNTEKSTVLNRLLVSGTDTLN